MTINEAIIYAEEMAATDGNRKRQDNYNQIAEWLKDYKRMLQQEPCEDAISRQAVLALITEYQKGFDAVMNIGGKVSMEELADDIKLLNSSVTPQPKIGHWINKSQRSGCGVLFVASECTCCGKKTPFNCDEFIYRYCPNCGAKMVEPRESEGE